MYGRCHCQDEGIEMIFLLFPVLFMLKVHVIESLGVTAVNGKGSSRLRMQSYTCPGYVL